VATGETAKRTLDRLGVIRVALNKVVNTPEKSAKREQLFARLRGAVDRHGLNLTTLSTALRLWSRDGYHDLDHLGAYLHHLGKVPDLSDADIDVLSVAALFHDAIYNGKPGDDEDKSIALYEEACKIDKRTPDPRVILAIEFSKSCERPTPEALHDKINKLAPRLRTGDLETQPMLKILLAARESDLSQVLGLDCENEEMQFKELVKWEAGTGDGRLGGVQKDFEQYLEDAKVDQYVAGRSRFLGGFHRQVQDLGSDHCKLMLEWLREKVIDREALDWKHGYDLNELRRDFLESSRGGGGGAHLSSMNRPRL
jgi:hypothetical protein